VTAAPALDETIEPLVPRAAAAAMTPAFASTLAGLGFIGAFISGMVGVGGAVVLIPLLYYVPPWLGVGALDIKLVAGVTMGQVLAAAIVGAVVHGESGAVHRPLVRVAGTSMAIASLTGAVASRYVGGRTLLAVFGTMGLLALLLMLLPPPPEPMVPLAAEVPFDWRAAVIYPAIIGLLSGLIGAGGAFLITPVLFGVMRIPLRLSIGTSLAIAGISALAGFLGKLVTEQVPLWPTVAVVLGSLAGAGVGAWASRRAPTPLLRASLATVIALVTLRVWIDVLSH
jgi:uncharacterized protein